MAGKLLFSTIGLLSRRFIAASLVIGRFDYSSKIESSGRDREKRGGTTPPSLGSNPREISILPCCEDKIRLFPFDRAKLTD